MKILTLQVRYGNSLRCIANNFATKMAFFNAETGAEGNFATKKAFFGAEIASEYNLATKT